MRLATNFITEAECAIAASDIMSGRWLTITGVAGCGKTTLAAQIFQQMQHINPHNGPRIFSSMQAEPPRRPRCVWMSESRFAERLRSKEYDLPEYLGDDWALALDDIGAARDRTDFLSDALYRLCNARLGKWTIFTTNLTLPEIAERVDERIASRLIRDGNRVCTITAGDYALRHRL